MNKHEQTGFSILTADNLYDQIAQLGITKKQILYSVDFKQLDMDKLSDDQRAQLRFAPVNEVVFLEGSEDLWFRTRARDWACTFVVLPGDFIPLIAEFKHGANIISITPPAGVPRRDEAMATCAKREFEEETGILLDRVEPVSGTRGFPLSGRKLTETAFPFVGFPQFTSNGSLVMQERRLDATENLLTFLMPFAEYWNFLGEQYENECGSYATAYAALRKLGRLSFA